MSSPLLALVCLLLSSSGVGCLYFSWRRKLSSGLWVSLGWLLLATSLLSWSQLLGVEFGVSYALLVLSLVAWLLALASLDRSRVNRQQLTSHPLSRPTWRTLGKHSGLMLLTVGVAGSSAALVSVGLLRLLPMQPVNTIVVAVLLLPLLWGLLAYWFCATEHLLKPTLVTVAAGALGALLVFA